MKTLLVSLCDTRAKMWYSPFPARSEAEALRMFREALSDANGLAGKYPEDFSLFVVGTWDADIGEVLGGDARLLTRGDILLEKIRTVKAEAESMDLFVES